MKDVIFEWWWAYGAWMVLKEQVNLEWVCYGLSVVFVLCLFATAFLLTQKRNAIAPLLTGKRKDKDDRQDREA